MFSNKKAKTDCDDNDRCPHYGRMKLRFHKGKTILVRCIKKHKSSREKQVKASNRQETVIRCAVGFHSGKKIQQQ